MDHAFRVQEKIHLPEDVCSCELVHDQHHVKSHNVSLRLHLPCLEACWQSQALLLRYFLDKGLWSLSQVVLPAVQQLLLSPEPPSRPFHVTGNDAPAIAMARLTEVVQTEAQADSSKVLPAAQPLDFPSRAAKFMHLPLVLMWRA